MATILPFLHFVQAYQPRVEMKRRLSMFPVDCSGACEGTIVDLMLRPGNVCPENIDYGRHQENFIGTINEICRIPVSIF